MASSQVSMQSALTGNEQHLNATSQGIGIASTQNPQQIIKTQQPNITYQIQRTQPANIGLVSAPSVINTKLGNPQLGASSQSIVASQAGITVVTGMPGSGTKSPIVNVAVTKPQMVPRTQVSIVSNSVTSNGATLMQQQQLRLMGIASGMSFKIPFICKL